MYFIYNKFGDVKMYSDSEQEYDTSVFKSVEIEPTPNELEKIKQNYEIKIVKKKLQFSNNDDQKKKDKDDEIRQEIVNATTINDIKDILIKLL